MRSFRNRFSRSYQTIPTFQSIRIWRDFPNRIPDCDATLLVPICRPIMCFPCCNCSSLNSLRFSSDSRGPKAGPLKQYFWDFRPSESNVRITLCIFVPSYRSSVWNKQCFSTPKFSHSFRKLPIFSLSLKGCFMRLIFLIGLSLMSDRSIMMLISSHKMTPSFNFSRVASGPVVPSNRSLGLLST